MAQPLTHEQRAVLAEMIRRSEARKIAADALREKIAQVRAALFPQQIAFLDDPHKAKAALCTRRAGKSWVICAILVLTALAGGNAVYITLTAKKARQIMWNGRSGLKAFVRRFGLPFEFNNTELIATAPNGATIALGGAETRDECEKYRGEPYAFVAIDEPASIKSHLEYLIDEVLEPTLLDEDGTIAMVGTPGRVLAGKFYEVTTGKVPTRDGDDDLEEDVKLSEWAVHKWSMLDNPHLKHRDRFMARVFRRHGWDPINPPPRAQREYQGKWVRENTTLVYPYTQANVCKSLPDGLTWRHILGFDLGTMAIEIAAYSPGDPHVFLVEGWKDKVGISAMVAKLQAYRVRYPGIRMIGDYGALGKQIIDEMNRRYSLGIVPAEKTDKAAYQEAMGDDLACQRVMVLEGNPILAEWDELQWAEPTGDPKEDEKRKEDPRFENHLSDSGLYAWREALHWLYKPAPSRLKYGSPEWVRAEADRLEREEDAAYSKAGPSWAEKALDIDRYEA